MEWGDANTNYLPDFVMFQNFKHQISCTAMRGEGSDKKYRSELTKTCHFKRKIEAPPTTLSIYHLTARVQITGDGGRVPQNLEWGTLMQIVLPDFVMFQNFKHQIARIAMRADGTEKNTAQNSPKHAISSEQFFFSGRGLSPSPYPLPVGEGTEKG